ncbi:ABC transporter permease [Falsigemmobacter intermedius]|uniref:ABC transporter permease n=1 Tax=Falsigemmobacter intermedius TaxID=1553448 RepID=A0A3S4XJI8_9RHOB|nr:ABC transporter permease [Falsigemmobacter intermedius]RWY37669.1 ABC transporter permease [Falsigemmobacter intermedius]
MLGHISRRLFRLALILWVVSILTFLMMELIPGDPVANVYGDTATPEQIAHLRSQLGLDQPLVTRYLNWASGVLRLDFGQSLLPPVNDVSKIMAASLPVTLQLSLMAVLMSLCIGLPMGAIAAYFEGTAFDRMISGISFGMLSLPSFVAGLLLINLLVFNITLSRWLLLGAGALVTGALLRTLWQMRGGLEKPQLGALLSLLPLGVGVLLWLTLPAFPRQGWVPISKSLTENLRHAFLPALTMAISVIPLYAQLLRSDMQSTLRQNFIMIARAKGATPLQIVLREALRPSLFSLVTVAALSFGTLLAGSVIVETIFNLPGLGKVVVNAIILSDYIIVQTGVLIAATIFVLLNAAVDLTYVLLDPRIRRAAD